MTDLAELERTLDALERANRLVEAQLATVRAAIARQRGGPELVGDLSAHELWLYCETGDCRHEEPVDIGALIGAHGLDYRLELVRQGFACPRCGGRQARLRIFADPDAP